MIYKLSSKVSNVELLLCPIHIKESFGKEINELDSWNVELVSDECEMCAQEIQSLDDESYSSEEIIQGY